MPTSASPPTDLTALAGLAAACRLCPEMRFSHVLGPANGPSTARVLFVGEAPGRLGAGRSGVPFQGDESGRRFDSLLAEAGLERDDVFITNAVLCNPIDGGGRNRRPRASDVKRCSAFLRGQIEALDPAIVVALGEVALNALGRIEPHAVRLRERPGEAVEWFDRRLVGLYHPARRALVHRSDALQREDWRLLGSLVAARATTSLEKPRLRRVDSGRPRVTNGS